MRACLQGSCLTFQPRRHVEAVLGIARLLRGSPRFGTRALSVGDGGRQGPFLNQRHLLLLSSFALTVFPYLGRILPDRKWRAAASWRQRESRFRASASLHSPLPTSADHTLARPPLFIRDRGRSGCLMFGTDEKSSSINRFLPLFFFCQLSI